MNSFIQLEHNYFALQINNDVFIVYNSFSGEPFFLSKEDFADFQNNDIEIENIDYSEAPMIHCVAKSDAYIENFKYPYVLDLIVSESCNLNCPMCFHASSMEKCESRCDNKKMSFEQAVRWIDYYIAYVKRLNQDKYSFHFGAAEPLLYKDVLWDIVSYIYKKADDRPLELYLNSNLTLLDSNDIEEIKKHSIRVAVGVDGLKEANDSTRKTKKGAGTFDLIVSNISKLVQAGVQVGVNVTLNNINFDKVNPEETVEFFSTIGIKHMLVDSDMVTHISYSNREIVDMYMRFLRAADKHGIEMNGSWRTPFDMLVFENTDIPKSFCASQLGKNLTVTPSGGLSFCTYSSELLAVDAGGELDGIMETFRNGMKNLMSNTLPGKNKECAGCPIEGVCLGGCHLAHEINGKNNFMCDIFLKSTEELFKYYYGEEAQV